METIKKPRLLYTLAFVLIAGLMCCCSDDRDHYGVSGGNEKMVTFSVKVPGSGTPRTYALDGDDENEVKSIAILLFDNAGKYTYQPVYNNKITTDQSDSKIKTFSVKIPEGTYSSLVILANANQVVSSAISSISTGDLKSDILKELTLANGKWNSSPGSPGYIDIPMWGEISSITIGSSTPANNPVNLVRMVSKIDVALTSPTAKSAFNLQSVRLYNYNDKGQVAPDNTNWDGSKATAPSVPSSAQKPSDPVNNPYMYDGAAITTAGAPTNRGISCTGEIYTFEAVAGSGTNLQTNTCLVIGGYYGSDSQLTYYRVDFANTAAGVTTYLALLRNHHYKVNISDVSGPGLPNPEDAFSAPPVNIKASIVEWNDGRFTEFAVNDQYLLGVSQGVFNFDREERTVSSTDNTLSVITDYSGGWKVSKIVDEDGNDINITTNPTTGWLSCSPASGSNPAGNDIKLLLKENTGTSGRTAFIHLTADADRLAYVVKVTQSAVQNVSLTIKKADGTEEISELLFFAPIGEAPVTQKFIVSWTPTGDEYGCAVYSYRRGTIAFPDVPGAVIPETDYISDISNSTHGSSSGPGSWTYTLFPPAIDQNELDANPFLEKTSRVDFTFSNGGSILSKSIFLRQAVGNLITDANSPYMLNGSQYSFRVRSNGSWRISNIVQNVTQGSSSGDLLALQSSDNLRKGAIGGYNTSPGTEIKFTVANDLNRAGTVIVTFENTDSPKRFADKTVVLNLMGEYYPAAHSGWAGSNIYWDGSKLTFDDTGVTTNQNYQGVYFQWGSLYGIAPNGASSSAWSTNKTVYKLDYSGGSYKHVKDTEATTWSSWPRVSDAPVTSNPPSPKIDRDRAYLYEITDETTGIGDICKYLTDKGWAPGTAQGKKWRMPTSNEFEAAAGYTKSGTWSSVTSNDAAGQYKNSSSPGWTKTGTGTPFFPAAGSRNYSDGTLGNVGSYGSYWSASPLGTYGRYMAFSSSNVNPNNINFRAYGFSVRCVQE